MSTAKKATTPTNEAKNEEKKEQKAPMKVSKSANEKEQEKPKMTVEERLEQVKKFEQLRERREVLKRHKDAYDSFRLGDTGFNTSITLVNESGTSLPIKNSEALKDIYPYLSKRIDQALERVNEEILEFNL